jgi:hypothetical protein
VDIVIFFRQIKVFNLDAPVGNTFQYIRALRVRAVKVGHKIPRGLTSINTKPLLKNH